MASLAKKSKPGDERFQTLFRCSTKLQLLEGLFDDEKKTTKVEVKNMEKKLSPSSW